MNPADESHDLLLIDGELRGSLDGDTYETINPATEEVLGSAADASPADVDLAIAAARRCFDETNWSRDLEFRLHCLTQLREAMQRHAPRMRALTMAETGAPKFLVEGPQYDLPVADIGWVVDMARHYKGWRQELGDAAPMGIGSRRYLLREAAGVVAAITPWNFPHQISLAKLGPSLAAGCTVVLKAAPDTPWCASAVAELVASETDFPPGALNIITGADNALGAELTSDPRVDLISFTGSTATGTKVMAAAAQNLTRVFLELGGKSAFVVLDDADIASAASLAAFTASTHAGQGCAITTRLLLPRARFDEGVEAAAATMTAIGARAPDEPGAVCGPVISARQRDRIEGYLGLALSEGARFACGGGRPPERERGFYVEPTLVVGLDNSSRVAQEEIFGPVLVALPYDTDAEAVAIANDSAFGLSGAVHSSDLDRARAVAGQIRTGTLSINGGVWYSPDVPFGGYKHSGMGREMGVAGFEEYLEIKAIAEAL